MSHPLPHDSGEAWERGVGSQKGREMEDRSELPDGVLPNYFAAPKPIS